MPDSDKHLERYEASKGSLTLALGVVGLLVSLAALVITFNGLQHGPLPEERASVACRDVLKDGPPGSVAEH